MAKIAVDFDGTIVEHCYPKIGKEIPFATETLRMLMAENHKLILWTVREGTLLDEAIEWCRQRGVKFFAVNSDYPDDELDKGRHFSRKLKVDYFIDDRNIGGLPDWGQIYRIIHDHRSYASLIREQSGLPNENKKKHWWNF